MSARHTIIQVVRITCGFRVGSPTWSQFMDTARRQGDLAGRGGFKSKKGEKNEIIVRRGVLKLRFDHVATALKCQRLIQALPRIMRLSAEIRTIAPARSSSVGRATPSRSYAAVKSSAGRKSRRAA